MTGKSKNQPTRIGDEILRGLGQMRDVLERGQPLESRFTMRTVELELEPRVYSAEEIQKIRRSFQASQAVFALMIGISPRTLQDWEQGRKAAPPWAGRLLQLMQEHPRPWVEMLEKAAVERKPA